MAVLAVVASPTYAVLSAGSMIFQICPAAGDASPSNPKNQYSFPFGMPLLRERLQAYFAAFYPEIPADADKNITVVLGATEGFAVCLRALCSPGDNVAFFQPFHELYPSQCTIFGLNPRAVTLREGADGQQQPHLLRTPGASCSRGEGGDEPGTLWWRRLRNSPRALS